jgi:diguanylate cyclase (GGDEF)-like protein/PAS domain S-box-containing protein
MISQELRTGLVASLLEALPDAVLVLDPVGEIAYANERWERMLHYRRGELTGHPASLVLPAGVAPGKRVTGGGALPVRAKNGKERLLPVAVSVLEYGDEALTVVTTRDPRARGRESNRLRRSEAALRAVLEGLPDAVVGTRPDGTIDFINARAIELFGYRPGELVGRPVWLLWPERLRERYSRNMRSFFDNPEGLRFERDARGLRKDGSEFVGEMSWGVVETDAGLLMLAVGRDMSQRLEAERRLKRRSAEHAVVASLGERALAGADPARLGEQVVEAVARTMEVELAQVLELHPDGGGLRTAAEWAAEGTEGLAPMSPSQAEAALGSQSAVFLRDLEPVPGAGETPGQAVRSGVAVAVRSGEEVLGVLAAYTVREYAFGGEDGAFLRAVANVLATAVARRRMEEQLRHQALHDPLTGIANRTLCEDRLTQAVARSRRSGADVAVLFLDLDGFKRVNDEHGHAAGDRVLTAFARRLADAVRPSDTVGRLGGDEFVVICEDMSEQDALALGGRLAHVARRPIHAGGAEQRFTASIGIALGDGELTEPGALVRAADAAAYRAKRKGRGGVELAWGVRVIGSSPRAGA